MSKKTLTRTETQILNLAEARGAHGLTNDELLDTDEHAAFNALVVAGLIVVGLALAVLGVDLDPDRDAPRA